MTERLCRQKKFDAQRPLAVRATTLCAACPLTSLCELRTVTDATIDYGDGGEMSSQAATRASYRERLFDDRIPMVVAHPESTNQIKPTLRKATPPQVSPAIPPLRRPGPAIKPEKRPRPKPSTSENLSEKIADTIYSLFALKGLERSTRAAKLARY